MKYLTILPIAICYLIANQDLIGQNWEEWEQEFELFRLGVLLEEARNKLGMTQEELAQKCGTNKSYISRIENNSSDIRLSTLMRIIQKGFGGHLKLTLKI